MRPFIRAASALVLIVLGLMLGARGADTGPAGARPAGAPAAGPGAAPLGSQFRETVQPFVQTYCVTCHGGEKPKGDLDLSAFTTLESVAKDHPRWALVLERLREGDMP